MLLLDLPPEIFQRIIRELVLNVGIHGAWKARLACGTFAAEIQHHVLATKPLDLLNTPPYFTIVRLNMPYLLYIRIKTGYEVVNDFPDQIKATAEYLHTNSNMYANQSADQCVKGVCQSISETNIPIDIIEVLQRGFAGSSRFAPFVTAEDKVALAARSGDYDLVRRLLSSDLANVKKESVLFGNPILHAAAQADADTLHFLLEELRGTFRQGSVCDKTTRTAKDIISTYSIPSAVETAIQYQRPDIINILVDWAFKYLKSKGQYHDWMRQAVVSGSPEVLQALIGAENRPRHPVQMATFQRACSGGHPRIVALLLGKGLLDPNKKFQWVSPLDIAIRYGRGSEIVRVILDAGAHPDGPHRDDEGSRVGLPLKTAISVGNKDVVMLLLERGASVGRSPVSWLRPAFTLNNREIYECVRSAALATGTKILTFDEVDALRKSGQGLYRIRFLEPSV
jgi:hypothetical protein